MKRRILGALLVGVILAFAVWGFVPDRKPAKRPTGPVCPCHPATTTTVPAVPARPALPVPAGSSRVVIVVPPEQAGTEPVTASPATAPPVTSPPTTRPPATTHPPTTTPPCLIGVVGVCVPAVHIP